MKKVLPWLKAHWIIPVLMFVALAVLPTAWYFADAMQTGFVAAFQKDVNTAYTSVSDPTAKIKVGIPSVDGSGSVLEANAVVNEALIKRYGEIWADVQGKVGGVSEKGLAFNKGEHKLLIDGLFPPPPDKVRADILGREFVERYIAFHKAILADIRAGEPARAEAIIQQLNDHRVTAENKIRAELGRDPNADEQATIAGELTGMRISAIRKRAAEIGVFADLTAFDDVPTSIPDTAPSPSQAWDKQERAWIDQDICHAVGLANGKTGGVSESVVKRLIKVAISKPEWDISSATPAINSFEPGEDKIPLNFAVSITGRKSGPGSRNKWYDVRSATVDVVVSSARLPQLLNALAATNFMTVTDLDIIKVDSLADLRDGFDYGDEHVVKATIQIETIWLREWRKAAMPPSVQKALGMDDKVEGGPAAASSAPPRPRPNPNAAGKPPAGGAPKGRGGRGGGGDD